METHKLFKVLVMGALLSVGCEGDDGGDTQTTTTETGEPSTGDGDPTTTTTGDGDGDPTTTGDGDGDPTTTGDGDGDGDGDTTTGDGDGDAAECCPPACWEEPCECTNGVCCWLVPPDTPGCEMMCP